MRSTAIGFKIGLTPSFLLFECHYNNVARYQLIIRPSCEQPYYFGARNSRIPNLARHGVHLAAKVQLYDICMQLLGNEKN